MGLDQVCLIEYPFSIQMAMAPVISTGLDLRVTALGLGSLPLPLVRTSI